MKRPALVAIVVLAIVAALWYGLQLHDGEGAPALVADSIEPTARDASRAAEPVHLEPPAADRVTAVADPVPDAAAAPDARYAEALGQLTGRFVEQDGSPVPALPVELLGASFADFAPDMATLFRKGGPPEFAPVKDATRSGSDGRFTFRGLDPRAHHMLGIDLGGARATCRFVDHAPGPGETVDLGDIVLEPTVALRGRVVDAVTAAPIAGARVRATNLPHAAFRFGAGDVRPGAALAFLDSARYVFEPPPWMNALVARLPVAEAVTDEQGAFSIASVPTGVVTTLVDADGYVSLVHGPTPTGGDDRDLGVLRMDEGETLALRVVTAAGEPVGDAEVRVGQRFGLPLDDDLALLRPTQRTGADGRCSADGLGSLRHVVAARAPDALDWTIVEDALPGAGEIEIRLAAGHDLTLAVVDPAGAPLPHPRLLVQAAIDSGTPTPVTPPVEMTNRAVPLDGGRLALLGLGASRYVLFVTADGCAIARLKVDLRKGPQDVKIVLQPAHELEVRVIAAADGSPVAFARVAARQREPNASVMTPSRVARTGEDGVATLGGLDAAPHGIVVEHPGFGRTEVEANVPGPPLVVALSTGGAIEGRVHRGGQPLDAPRFLVLESRRNAASFPRFTLTDADGAFRAERLEPGSWRLLVLQRAYHRAPGEFQESLGDMYRPERRVAFEVADGATTRLDVDLLASETEGLTATLRGRVLVNGKPGAGIPIHARTVNDMAASKSTRTDATGAFDFGVLRAGFIVLEFGTLRTMELNLNPGQNEDMLVELGTGWLRCRVESETGEPIAGASVDLYGNRSSGGPSNLEFLGRHVTDGTGTFAMELDEDTYQVRVEADGYAQIAAEPVTVPPLGTADIGTVVLRRGVVVSGSIRLAERPRKLRVRLDRAKDVYDSIHATSDPATGAFSFEHVLPGAWQVSIWDGSTNFEPIPLEVPEGGLSGIVLEPKPKQKTK